MKSTSEGKAASPVLDQLKTWFHHAQKVPKVLSTGKPENSKKQPPHAPEDEPCKPILEFKLPPRKGHKTAKAFAIFLLRAGAEIEHSLLIQYLYAAYSINEQKGDSETNVVALRWKTHIRLVAREEMAHLITVQNLLRALGEDPHLNRGHIHRKAIQQAIPFKLEPLSLNSLAKYVVFESPSTDQIHKDCCPLFNKVVSSLDKDHQGLFQVGTIYAALYWLFCESDAPDPDWPFPQKWIQRFRDQYPKLHLDQSDFALKADYDDKAALPEEWGIFESNTRADSGSPREIALASLRWIMAQGEGPNAIEDSHFYRFLRMYEEFDDPDKARRGKTRSLIMKVPENPFVAPKLQRGVRNKKPAEWGNPITRPRSREWAQLLNVRYQLMLLDVFESLTSSRATASPARQRLARWAGVEMEFVKKIGQALPHMLLKKGKKSEYAGAPFQMAPGPPASHPRPKLLSDSRQLVKKVRSGMKRKAQSAIAALELSLLEAIVQHDDDMQRLNG